VEPGDRVAGKWGDFDCDIPKRTFESMLQYIKDNVKPDLILWTGDNTPHNVWDEKRSEVYPSTSSVTEIIKSYIGSSIPVFPVAGNHDTYPLDQESFSKPYSNPYTQKYAELWSDWLGPEAKAQFKKFGYYYKDVVLRNSEHGKAAVIGINTNVCALDNWSLLANATDPGNTLAWLEQTLRTLESQNKGAIIIGHIPPQEGCN